MSLGWSRINTDVNSKSTPLRVLVTGAAGQIGYNLLFNIANGLMFGKYQTVILHLYDVMVDQMEGIKMELIDCCFPLLVDVITSNKEEIAFKDVEIAILVAGLPRKKGMERKELIGMNTRIMKQQALAIKQYSSRDIRILVVANPANTNALVIANYTGIDTKHITSLSRLDQNRAIAQVASKMNVNILDVKDVFVWGNHSEKQCPDISNSTVNSDGKKIKVKNSVDADWLNSFDSLIQQRGAKVIECRNASSAASASKAIVDHMHDWCLGTDKEKIICMGVYSQGEYGISKGIFFSMPVICYEGDYHVVDNLVIDESIKNHLIKSDEELIEERKLEIAFEKITEESLVHD